MPHPVQRKGLRIPEDVAIVGFSNEPTSALIEPGLTTLAQPLDEIGKATVQLLLNEIETDGELCEPKTEVLKTQLIVRASSLKKH